MCKQARYPELACATFSETSVFFTDYNRREVEALKEALKIARMKRVRNFRKLQSVTHSCSSSKHHAFSSDIVKDGRKVIIRR